MKIDKVILASNNNKDYLDFWPIVSEAWLRMDIEPVLIYTGKEKIKLDGNVINYLPTSEKQTPLTKPT